MDKENNVFGWGKLLAGQEKRQTERFYELRDRATARMLGLEYNPKGSGETTGFGDLLKYLFGL